MIKAEGRSLIVDTGMNQKECEDAISQGLNELGIDLRRTDIFITHFHEDHIGLVPNLATDTLTIYFNKVEADIVTKYISERPDNSWWENLSDFLRMRGFPDDELHRFIQSDRDRGRGYQIRGRLNLRILEDGETIDIGNYSFKCIETPGHSPGHFCLYEPNKKVFISGDHILGEITPIIPLYSEEMNPLKDYLASLDKIQNLDVEYVLPAHGNVFRNFKGRIKELRDHHQKRANDVLCILEKGFQNPFQIASQMSWDIPEPWDQFPASQKWFACGEALAHLKYLEEQGRIQRRVLEQKILFSLK